MPKQSKQNTPQTLSQQESTQGLQTLLGDPKKAIIKLATPMIIALTLTTLYTLVDALWVSGLGPDALAAVGFVFPFFFMAMALASGLGVGGGSAVARNIGAKNKKGADDVAMQTLVIMFIVAIFFTIPFFIFAEPIFSFLGAGETTHLAAIYARVMSLGTAIVFFSLVGNALLRSEGDANRAMKAMGFGAILNMILDPIYIYILNLGIAGAAWATLTAMAVTASIIFYWMFLKKDTYLNLTLENFRFKKFLIKEIVQVGLPASLQQFSMAIMMLTMNIIIITVIGSTDGVAVYSAGWRISTIATLPLLGIASAVVSVTGAAYGAKDYNKLKTAYYYAIKFGLLIEIILSIATFILAPIIALAFTQAEGATRIAQDIELFLRIACFYFPSVAFGMLTSSMFQGTAKGLYALIVSLLRTILLIPPFTLLFAEFFHLGLSGLWIGLVAANIVGSLIAFIWGKLYVKKLARIDAKEIKPVA